MVVFKTCFSPDHLLQTFLLGRGHMMSPWAFLAAPPEAEVDLPPQVPKADLPETLSHHTLRYHPSTSFRPPGTLRPLGRTGCPVLSLLPMELHSSDCRWNYLSFLPASGPQWFHSAVAGWDSALLRGQWQQKTETNKIKTRKAQMRT